MTCKWRVVICGYECMFGSCNHQTASKIINQIFVPSYFGCVYHEERPDENESDHES